MIRRSLFEAALSALLLVVAVAQAATAAQTMAPAQVCINNSCVTTASTTNAPAGKIKWNPGHYMASNTLIYPGRPLSTLIPEMNALNNQDAILGYRIIITWNALEDATAGRYDFSLLDAILSRLKAAYNKPKRLVLVVLPGAFRDSGGAGVPAYIRNSSAYGPSPYPGSYGWWGPSAGAVGAVSAALWRPAVMARYIALISALGARYDSDPYFEGIMIQEDAWIVSTGTYYSPSDYNGGSLIEQLEAMLTTATAAFPTTNVIMENTWVDDSTPAQQFEQWLIEHRVAPGAADTVGQKAFNLGYGTADRGLSWGLKAYFGLTQTGSSYGGPDYRGTARAMLDVESQELAGSHYQAWGGAPSGFTPLDIITAANQSYKASHLFWTHFFGKEGYPVGGIPAAAIWVNLAATCAANPLTNTSYPGNYP